VRLLLLQAWRAIASTRILIRGERKTIDQFWKLYAGPEQEPRFVWREFLLERKEPLPPLEPVNDLRRATLDDLDQVLKLNAGLASQERGINPLNLDPAGFVAARPAASNRAESGLDSRRENDLQDRCLGRDAAGYIPGRVHVHPEERMKGYGTRCLTQLSSICSPRRNRFV